MSLSTMSSRRQAGVLLSVSGAVSVVLLGTTILNVALPALRTELHTTNIEQQWILNAYTLAFAGFLLVAGAMGDRFGLRRTLLVGLGGFAVTTGVAAFASSPIILIVMRALAGVFAAAIMPISLAVIVRSFRSDKVPTAIATWAAASGVAIALGPLVGGALLSAGYWWGSVLLVVAIASVLALVGAWFTVPESKPQPGSDSSSLRIGPVAASIAGITLLVWGILHGGQDSDWLAPATLLPSIAGVFVLAVLVFAETRHRAPLVDARLFRHSQFSGAVLALTLGTFAVYGFLYFSTFYLQVQRGYSPLQTGALLIPVSLGIVVGGPISRMVVSRLGSRGTMASGLTLVALALALVAVLNADTPIVCFELLTFAVAFGFALVLAPGTTVAMSAIPAAKAGTGSALINTLRQLGSAMGVAVLGSILWSKYQTSVQPRLDGLDSATRETASNTLAATMEAGRSNPSVLEAASDSFNSAMQVTSLVAGGLAAVGAGVLVVSWLRGNGRED